MILIDAILPELILQMGSIETAIHEDDVILIVELDLSPEDSTRVGSVKLTG